MEHPEKALFDEVRGLRNQLEESKERVLKIENDYNEKVLAYETRKTINDRLNNKIDEFVNDTKKVTIIVNGKEYPVLRSFLTKNLFIVNFLTEEDTYELDMSKSDFKGLMSILRNGHNYYGLDKGDLPRKFTLDKPNLKDDKAFISIIRNYLSEESFDEVLNKFDMVYSYVSSDKDLIQEIKVDNPYINTKLEANVAKSPEDITIKDQVSPKAYFINANGKIDIVLKSRIRIDKVKIRGFFGNSSNWTSSNGRNTTKIYVSLDGENWIYTKSVPNIFGNGKEVITVSFDKNYTFKYLRFQTDNSNSFSLNYIAFNK